jgi:DNA-binding transcriptional ArsR family regulator
LINEYVVDRVAAVTSIATDAALDAGFAALADPTRRAIVARLARGEATVGELARPFPLSQQAVSRHIGVLRRCGLIDQRVDGQRRPCRLNAVRMAELDDWIAGQRREWEGRLDTLEAHLAATGADRS